MLYYELKLKCIMKVSKDTAKMVNKDKEQLKNILVRVLNDCLRFSKREFGLHYFGALGCDIISLNNKKVLESSYSIIAATQTHKEFDNTTRQTLANKIASIFPVRKLNIQDKEVTPEYILQKTAECKLESSVAFIKSMNIPENTYGEFRYSEDFIEKTDLSLSSALKEAEDIMADEAFREEIKRIYSNDNSKQFITHPVHYYLTAKDKASVSPMIKLLLQSLYANNRIPSLRIDSFSNFDAHIEDTENLTDFFKMSEGASVVIDTFKEDSLFKTGRNNMIEVISSSIKRISTNTLFIVVNVQKEANFGMELLENLKKMRFVKIGTENKLNEPLEDVLERIADKYKLIRFYKANPPKIDDSNKEYTYDEALEIFNDWKETIVCQNYYKAYTDIKPISDDKLDVKAGDSMANLEQLVGLSNAKEVAKELIAAARVNKARKEKGFTAANSSLHMIFTGNPGSAKTTFARLIAQVLADYGVTKKAAVVECGRADLVGKYVGWTANCVREKFKEASGGVLFIDEAYSLCGEGKDFGAEAINTIVQEMENHRDDVVVIFAGYPDKIEEFLRQNEGLRSRIPYHMEFPDYNEEELMCIFQKMADARQYIYTKGFEKKLREKIKEALKSKDFGNGRFVRNVLELAIAKQAVRITDNYDLDKIDMDVLRYLKAEDFPNVQVKSTNKGYTPVGIAL